MQRALKSLKSGFYRDSENDFTQKCRKECTPVTIGAVLEMILHQVLVNPMHAIVLALVMVPRLLWILLATSENVPLIAIGFANFRNLTEKLI